MHARPGEVATENIQAIKIVWDELEEITAELSMRKALQIDLRWSHHKYAGQEPGNHDTEEALLEETASATRFQ